MTTINEGIDTNLSSLAFWAKPPAERHETFRWLRENEPIIWNEPPEALDPNLDNSKGFWSLTKHQDIQEVSRRTDVFSSAEGVFIDDFPQLETMLSFIVTDAPRHTEMRGIVSIAFTPKNIATIADNVRQIVREVIDEVAPKGEGDLCELITKVVPGRTFATFMGITDPDQIQYVMDAAEQFASWNDPEYAHIGSPLQVFADAAAKLGGLALELAKDRQKNPGNDLLTWVAQAQYEGNTLSVEEVGAFFALLAGGANDTTRHSMAHVLALFDRHPDQLAYLLEDFDARADDAINECLRVEPPLMHFRRTATQDYQLRDVTIKAGDKVTLWYVSSNRDSEVFDNPDTFDIRRSVKHNPHQAFGGGGPHYCLGHVLAKVVLKSQIHEIYTRMKDIRVGEPELLLSNFMNGVKRLPATWTPEQR
ncbi:cytochrome P450 [Nocardia nova]|uniref:Cytochrome P450 n=1 Tax=Nocardia nova TaxID=37330 RepID=A0A2S6A1W8_9NOCA|nr:cytochrome P450 [Nocardia nova]PPJ25551.1 cytochrome P450 [Nocardia nova]